MVDSRTVTIVCHRRLGLNQRGAENSVALIRDHLLRRGHVVHTPHYSHPDLRYFVARSNVVLSWGVAVSRAHDLCRAHHIPHIIMVRWWRNICPLPPGDLMKRPIPEAFTEQRREWFEYADAIVTNNRWAVQAIRRFQPTAAPISVSYVAVPGGLAGSGNPNGPVLLVTDNKDLGGPWLVEAMAEKRPDMRFLVVNSRGGYNLPNVDARPYTDDMDAVYREAGVMIYPVYANDVCGTSRVGMEAARFGVPAVANDRSGICEAGMIPVPRDASPDRWIQKLDAIYENYDVYTDLARAMYERHRPEVELDVYHHLIMRHAR